MAYGAIIGQTPTVQASAEMTSYNNDNTSSVITADNVQGAIDQLFTSVSNGKSQIASAITGMGVSTSANDSFAQMATNIGNIETGPDWSEVESPAGAAQILAPYQTYDSSNKLIKGTITSKGAQTYTPKTVSQTISSGQYLSGNQTIQGDENLKASNIKSGVSIFGVDGNLKSTFIFDNKNALNISARSDTSYTISYIDIEGIPSSLNVLSIFIETEELREFSNRLIISAISNDIYMGGGCWIFNDYSNCGGASLSTYAGSATLRLDNIELNGLSTHYIEKLYMICEV